MSTLIPSDERKGQSLNISIFVFCGLTGWSLVALVKALVHRTLGYKVPPVFVRIAFSVVSSVLLLLVYHFYEGVLQTRLSLFDLDGDGIFSPAEQTPEQEVAMDNLINDSGRNFVKVLGVTAYWFVAILSMLRRSRGEFGNDERKQ